MPVPAGKSKLEDTQKIKWSTIPFSCFYNINKYASDSPFEVYQLSRVCMVWRHYLQSEEALYLWKNF